jgi:hypothetical protein
MKRLLSNFYEYLLNVDWDNEDDIEAWSMIQILGHLSGLVLLAIGYFFGFVPVIVAVFVFLGAVMWIHVDIKFHQEELREQALEEARAFDFEPNFVNARFLDDEDIGGQHLD